MTRIEILENLMNMLHRLHTEVGIVGEDPIIFPSNKTCNCNHWPQDRKEIVEYVKNRLDDKEFLSTILTDEFLNVDDPEVLKNKQLQEFKNLHSFSDNVSELIVDIQQETLCLDSRGDSNDVADLISDIKTFSGYIVIFDDSDGERVWYEKVPSKDILKHVIKKQHRKSIGCNCNQYIHMVIFNKTEIDWEE